MAAIGGLGITTYMAASGFSGVQVPPARAGQGAIKSESVSAFGRNLIRERADVDVVFLSGPRTPITAERNSRAIEDTCILVSVTDSTGQPLRDLKPGEIKFSVVYTPYKSGAPIPRISWHTGKDPNFGVNPHASHSSAWDEIVSRSAKEGVYTFLVSDFRTPSPDRTSEDWDSLYGHWNSMVFLVEVNAIRHYPPEKPISYQGRKLLTVGAKDSYDGMTYNFPGLTNKPFSPPGVVRRPPDSSVHRQ